MGWKTYAIVGGMLTRKPTPNPTRRDFLRSSFVAGGVLLAGFDKLPTLAAKMQAGADAFEGGKHLGNLDFAGESRAPLDALSGSELDARLYSDLSRLTPENPIPPTERFYVRTCASHLLNSEKGWQIQLDGLVDKAATLDFRGLSGHGDERAVSEQRPRRASPADCARLVWLHFDKVGERYHTCR